MIKTIQSNAFYLLISLAGSSTTFLLIPLYVSSFSVDEYGLYALMSSFLTFLTIFIALNLDSAVQTFFFDHHQDALKLKAYLKNIVSFALLISSILMTLIIWLGPYLFNWIFDDASITFFPYGLIVTCNAWVSSINQIYLVLLRNQEKLKKYGMIVIASSVLSLVLQFFMIYFMQLDVVGALIGGLIPNVLLFIHTLSTKSFLTARIEKTFIKKSLRFSLLLLPFLFIQWFLARGDRFIVENFIGLEHVGVYALLMNVSMIMAIIATSILNSIRPSLYREFKQNHGVVSRKIIHYFIYYLFITGLAGSAIYLLVQNIQRFNIASAYYSIQPLIGLAIILFGIRILVRFFNEYLNYKKRSGLLSLLSTLNLIIFLCLIVVNQDNISLNRLLEILIISNLTMLLGTIGTVTYQVRNQRDETF